MLVLGLGGAGCNIAGRMAAQWSEGPAVLGANTDRQALAACGLANTLLVGEQTTRGLGTAGDPQVGRLAAEESLGALQARLAGVDLLLLVAGLGGGTGTGSLPVVAKAARQMGALTLAVVTMPFPFEGERRRRLAEDALRSLQRVADAVICFPNERLVELADSTVGVAEVFAQSDAMLAAGVHALWYLLSKAGIVNLTFADVRELAERSGGSLAYGFAEASGPARAASALAQLMDSPLLDHGRLLAEAQGLIINIAGGPDLTLADLEGIMGQVAAKARPNVHVSMGAMIDPTRRERLTITLLASSAWNEDRFTTDLKPGETKPGDKPAPPPGGVQGELPLGEVRKAPSAFGNAPPTFLNGQDLDIPTFLRRGIKLSFER